MSVQLAKFHEKAIAIYAVPQIGENYPAVLSNVKTTGTIGGTSGSTAITGSSTAKFLTQLTPGVYLRRGDGVMVGQIASVESDTSATLVSNFTGATFSGKTFSTELGPKNCMAVLNLNFNPTELTSEAYQYAGDELDRAETTVITDWTATMDFETFLPVLPPVTGTPTDDQLIGKEWFEACGFDVTPSNKKFELSNIASTNTYLTVEIHRTSADMPLNAKIYTMSNVRGTVDLDLVIGTKAKLKWNMFGNYVSVTERLKITPDKTRLTNQKSNIGSTVNATSITSSVLGIKGAKAYELSVPKAKTPGNGDRITFGGLTIDVGQVALTARTLVFHILKQITKLNTATDITKYATDLNVTTPTVAFTSGTTFGSWEFEEAGSDDLAFAPTDADLSAGALVAKPITPNKGTTAVTFTWAVGSDAKTVYVTSITGTGKWLLTIPTATTLAANTVVGIGNATITIPTVPTTYTSVAPSLKTIYNSLSKLTPGMTSAEAKVMFTSAGVSVGDVTGKFGNWIITRKTSLTKAVATAAAYDASVGGLLATPVYPNKGATTFPFTWTATTPNVVEDETNTSSLTNVSFDKLSAPNLPGFEYSRFRTSAFDSWSKGAIPSDVTFTILEDRKTGAYTPELELENEHMLQLAYTTSECKVTILFERLQLTGIANSTIGSYAARDLTFRNTASKSESLGTKLTLEDTST